MLGIDLGSGRLSKHGFRYEDYGAKFNQTFSGHYHRMSEHIDGRVIYTGSPYQITRDDIGLVKGFWVYDFDSNEKELIENNTSMKFKILKYPCDIDEEEIKNCMVDVMVPSDLMMSEEFQQWSNKLDAVSGINPSYKIEELDGIDIENLDQLDEILDLGKVCNEYINQNVDEDMREDVIDVLKEFEII
jgi:hypothetical protein